MFIGFVCSCACMAFWRVYKLYAIVVRECAVSRFRRSKSSYTPNSIKVIVGAFSHAYRYVMDKLDKGQEQSRKTDAKQYKKKMIFCANCLLHNVVKVL